MKPNALALAVLTAALVLAGCKDSPKPGATTEPTAAALTEAAAGETDAPAADPLAAYRRCVAEFGAVAHK